MAQLSELQTLFTLLSGTAFTFAGIVLGRRGQKANAEKTLDEAAQITVNTMKEVMDAQKAVSESEIEYLLLRIKTAENAAEAAKRHATQCDFELSVIKLKLAQLEAALKELKGN